MFGHPKELDDPAEPPDLSSLGEALIPVDVADQVVAAMATDEPFLILPHPASAIRSAARARTTRRGLMSLTPILVGSSRVSVANYGSIPRNGKSPKSSQPYNTELGGRCR
jgi:hypothetical protein